MPKNVLVINVDIRETRVALIESGIIAELHVERASTRGTLGNIILGKVTRVLPGMQAAFIDIGLERAAFLHVEDLIRPDDFEAFLAGSKREESEGVPDESAARRAEAEAAGANRVGGPSAALTQENPSSIVNGLVVAVAGASSASADAMPVADATDDHGDDGAGGVAEAAA